MKKLLIFLCAMFLVFGFIGSAGADTFLPGVSVSGGWNDVYQQPYGNLCWAASASDMLAYAGWDGGTALDTADEIFNYFSGHWQNVDGNPYYAVEWWGNGSNSGPAYMAQVTTPGGNFYPSNPPLVGYGFSENMSEINTNLTSWISSNVGSGSVGTILLGNESGGIHWLTYWGYGTDGVWVTDSFTSANEMTYQTLSQDASNNWHLADYSGMYVISAARLDPNALDIAPSNPVNEGPGDEEPTEVPEPATLFLLGSSLVGLIFFRKRT